MKLKQFWNKLPPPAKTFLKGLLLAVLLPLVIAVKDPSFSEKLATDPLAVLLALGASIAAAAVHYAKQAPWFDYVVTAVAVVCAIGGYSYAALGSQTGAPTPLVDTGDTTTYKITPREAGAKYQAAQLVCDPTTKLEPPTVAAPQLQLDGIGPVMRFSRGQEIIDWSSNRFTNPTGTYYPPSNRGEDANFDDTAIACAKKLGGFR